MESRSSWGAGAPSEAPVRWAAGMPQGLVVHWVGGGAMRLDQKPHADCRTAVRSIDAYERSHGYAQVAYNTLACPHGILIEGRGLGVQGAANGGGKNGTYASVCVLGGIGDAFTDGHKKAIEEAYKYFPGRLLPHREVNSTSCPGDEITAWVHARAAGTGTVVEPRPPAQNPSPSPGGDLVNLYHALHSLAGRIAFGRTLRVTNPIMTGTDVAECQLFLVGACGQKIAVDGAYGPQTAAAVVNFQKFFHLTPDGIFGPQSRLTAAKVLAVRFP